MNPPGGLPLPIAGLIRRAINAKSAKERHDTAYWAWEASVKLTVAAKPPQDPGPLARGSVGHWVHALELPEVKLSDRPLVDCCHLFADKPPGSASSLRSISPRDLLVLLPAYRNRVIGHGSTRDSKFYEIAADKLQTGLEAAWRNEIFWPDNARLVYVESVELDPDGARRARIIDLMGELGHVVDPRGTPGVPGEIRPGNLYLRKDRTFHSLHPWLLFHESESLERVYFFNSLGRTPQYLDYLSGEILRGQALRQRFLSVEEDVTALFAVSTEEREETDEAQTEDPKRVGDFHVLEKLGEGGMGVVHLASQKSLERLVAIKMLPEFLADNPVAVARFKQEIAALSRCEHPNVVKILSSGKARSTYFYAMEFVDGVDLARIHDALSTSPDFDRALSTASGSRPGEQEKGEAAVPHPPRDLDDVRPSPAVIRRLTTLFVDAARGMDHLHENGVIHRDLKPSNLMVTLSGQRIVIMDLGLAKVREASKSITLDRSQILGTLRYIPPEQLQRSLITLDHRADIYSLGATFYELITGQSIFTGETEAQLIEQVLLEVPPNPSRVNPAVPRDLATIIRKTTEKDPRLRYQDAGSLVADLDAVLQNRPISARPPTFLYLLKLALQRNKAVAATVAGALIVVLALLVFYGASQRQWARSEEKARKREESVSRELAYRLDISLSKNLLNERNSPPPLVPDSLPAFRKWIEPVEALVSKLEHYRRELEATGSSERSPQDRSELEGLIENIQKLADPHLPRARNELNIAAHLKEYSLDRAQAAWREAIADMAGLDIYRDVGEVKPQLGLVPIHRDPDSGLWEFWHVASGTRPRIDPESGKVILTRETGIILVLLPGGTFRSGSPKTEKYHQGREERLHRVTLAPFFIGKFEVTKGQWKRIMYADPSLYPPGKEMGGKVTTWLNPVECMTWLKGRNFMTRLSLQLPTEAQWEYACRAGTRNPYMWGNTPAHFEGKENLRDHTSAPNSPKPPLGVGPWDDGFLIHAPVGTFKPNRFGLHDMLGNVSEWTADAFSYDFPEDLGKPGDGRNTLATGRKKVFRGGSFFTEPRYARVAQRYRLGEITGNANIGLRVARALIR